MPHLSQTVVRHGSKRWAVNLEVAKALQAAIVAKRGQPGLNIPDAKLVLDDAATVGVSHPAVLGTQPLKLPARHGGGGDWCGLGDLGDLGGGVGTSSDRAGPGVRLGDWGTASGGGKGPFPDGLRLRAIAVGLLQAIPRESEA